MAAVVVVAVVAVVVAAVLLLLLLLLLPATTYYFDYYNNGYEACMTEQVLPSVKRHTGIVELVWRPYKHNLLWSFVAE